MNNARNRHSIIQRQKQVVLYGTDIASYRDRNKWYYMEQT